jgi:predicted peptidase
MQLQHDRENVQPAFCTTPDEVHDFIAYAVAHYNVDPKRVYVTGLSCGAFGIWEYLAKYHASVQVAAAVPIAGEGRPAWATVGCDLESAPIWAFHGALDDVVNPQGSIETMTNLAACPGIPANEAQLTVYPDRDHNSWDPAYSGSEGDDIYSWMLGFSQP